MCQGDPPSPLLFCLVLNCVFAYLTEHAPLYTQARCLFLLMLVATLFLLYVDNILLLAGGLPCLQTLLDALGDFSTTYFMSLAVW